MFEPEKKSNFFLIIIAVVASFIGWAILAYGKPMILQASCSEIAASSSGFIYNQKSNVTDTDYSYEKIRQRCLSDVDK